MFFANDYRFPDPGLPDGTDLLEVVEALLSGRYEYEHKSRLLLRWQDKAYLKVQTGSETAYADGEMILGRGEKTPEVVRFSS